MGGKGARAFPLGPLRADLCRLHTNVSNPVCSPSGWSLVVATGLAIAVVADDFRPLRVPDPLPGRSPTPTRSATSTGRTRSRQTGKSSFTVAAGP